jgi:homocysteine S-methyltransferase
MPGTFKKALNELESNFNWGFYLNCGSGNYSDEIIKCSVPPKEYLKNVKSSLKRNPSFIGSCCGSSPAHIKEIKRLLDGRI